MANNEEEPKSAVGNAFSRIVRGAGYALGAIVGIGVADVGLRTNVYKNAARRGAFGGKIHVMPEPDKIPTTHGMQVEEGQRAQKIWYDALIKKTKENGADKISDASKQFIMRYENAHNVTTRTFEGPIISVLDETSVAGKNAVEQMSTLLNKSYRKEVRNFFLDLDIKSWRQYWPLLTRNQKIETAGLAMTASAVMIGAMLAISDHKKWLTQMFPDKTPEPGALPSPGSFETLVAPSAADAQAGKPQMSGSYRKLVADSKPANDLTISA